MKYPSLTKKRMKYIRLLSKDFKGRCCIRLYKTSNISILGSFINSMYAKVSSYVFGSQQCWVHICYS